MKPDTRWPFDLPEMQIALKTKLKVRIKLFPRAKHLESDVGSSRAGEGGAGRTRCFL